MIQKIQYLKNNRGFTKYFKNTLWLFIERILRMIVGLLIGIWMARYLGPKQFGLLSYVISFVGLFSTIATLGLDSVVVRELVSDEKKRNKLISTVFWLKVIGAFIVFIILAIAINFTTSDAYTNTLIFIIASAVFFQSFNVVDMYFQSIVMSKYVVYINVVSLFISSLIKIILIVYGAPLEAFALVIVFDSFILASGFVYCFFKKSTFSIQHLKFNKFLAVSLLKDSWPLVLSGIIISIYMKIDQVMIKEMLNSEAVGQYSAAVKISEAWYFIPIIVASSLFPAIINAKNENKKLYYKRLQSLYRFMIWIAIIVALPMTFLSNWLIDFLYGSAYNEAGTVLSIHIWAVFFAFIGIITDRYLIVENLQKITIITTVIGTIINILLNYILIPKLGIIGASISTVITLFIVDYILLFFIKKTRKIFYLISRSLFYI